MLKPDSRSEQEGALSTPLPFPVLLFQGFLKGIFSSIRTIGFDLIFVVMMATILLMTLIKVGAHLRVAQASVLYPIGMMIFLLISQTTLWYYRQWRGLRNPHALSVVSLQGLRDWFPFILIDFIYENLHDLAGHFQKHDVAGIMLNWDVKIFGVEPTLWMQRFVHPFLVDYMAFTYALYFILPLLTMYLLSYRHMRSDLREMVLALSLCFLIGFLGYVFFPCSPPRYYLAQQYTQPVHLQGYFLFNYLQGKWDNLSVIPSGAFPSLHVAISTIALIYAARFRKRSRTDLVLFIIWTPLIVSLWISTVYLRHHWFVDILAGWILALFCCWVAPLFIRFEASLKEALP